MRCNVSIPAAGRPDRFAPFTCGKPKNLLRAFAVKQPDADVITGMAVDGAGSLARVGRASLNEEISANICRTLRCAPGEIKDISALDAGLTNVSFAFSCRGSRYVYRHPGGTAGNLVDRPSELYAQTRAKELGLDRSFIRMDPSGWKISHYIKGARNCDFERDHAGMALSAEEQLAACMDCLHRLHAVPAVAAPLRAFAGQQGAGLAVREFDDVEEGKRLMRIASFTQGGLLAEFATEIEQVERLYGYVKADAVRLGYQRVLCHNDVYTPNCLIGDAGEFFLIDWEYAGLNYAANDISCILCRYDWTDVQVERYLQAYVGRELRTDEARFYHAFIPVCAFYWFCWGLYKGSVGDGHGFFFLPAYRNFVRYIGPALKSYEE